MQADNTPRFEGLSTLCIIGETSMSTVYKAVDEAGLVLAIKSIASKTGGGSSLETLGREAIFLEALGGNGFPLLIKSALDHNPPYIATSFVEGSSLTQHVADLDSTARIDVIARTCDHIQRLHDEGIAHCDIKPDNVMVDTLGEPTVIDLGVAVNFAPGIRMREAPEPTFAGTIAYASPEALIGASPDARGDVYSLGVILFELLHGDLPFGEATDTRSQLARIRPLGLRAPKSWDPLAKKLFPICRRALEPDPRFRHASATKLAAELRCAANGGDIATDTPWHLARCLGRSITELWRAAASAAAVVLAIYFGTLWLIAPSEKQTPEYLAKSHAAWNAPNPKTPAILAIYSNDDFGKLHFDGLRAAVDNGAQRQLELLPAGYPKAVMRDTTSPEFSRMLEDVRTHIRSKRIVAVVGPCHTSAVAPIADAVHSVNSGIPILIESSISRRRLGTDPNGSSLIPGHPVYRVSSGVDERASKLRVLVKHQRGEGLAVAIAVDKLDGDYGKDLAACFEAIGIPDDVVIDYPAALANLIDYDVLYYFGLASGFKSLADSHTTPIQLIGFMNGYAFSGMNEHQLAICADISDLGHGRVATSGVKNDASRSRFIKAFGQDYTPAMRDQVFSFDAGLCIETAFAKASANENKTYGELLHALCTHLESDTLQGLSGIIRFPIGGGQNVAIRDSMEVWKYAGSRWETLRVTK